MHRNKGEHRNFEKGHFTRGFAAFLWTANKRPYLNGNPTFRHDRALQLRLSWAPFLRLSFTTRPILFGLQLVRFSSFVPNKRPNIIAALLTLWVKGLVHTTSTYRLCQIWKGLRGRRSWSQSSRYQWASLQLSRIRWSNFTAGKGEDIPTSPLFISSLFLQGRIFHPRFFVSIQRVLLFWVDWYRSDNNPPIATVPTLVVPLQKTLGPDTESRYKAITDTKACVIPE